MELLPERLSGGSPTRVPLPTLPPPALQDLEADRPPLRELAKSQSELPEQSCVAQRQAIEDVPQQHHPREEAPSQRAGLVNDILLEPSVKTVPAAL